MLPTALLSISTITRDVTQRVHFRIAPMFDPYARDTPGVSDPANDLFLITPSDTGDLDRGVKALRIWNPTDEPALVSAVTIGGTAVTLTVPPESLWVEALRVAAVRVTGTSAGLIIHGYTD